MLPALPFTILMPALSLLLVFRTNTGYSRWNEARTPWGCNPTQSGLQPHASGLQLYMSTYAGAHAVGWRHQQLPQRRAPEQQSNTSLPCTPASALPLPLPLPPAPCPIAPMHHAPCPVPLPLPLLCQVRQSNTFFPDDARHRVLKRR